MQRRDFVFFSLAAAATPRHGFAQNVTRAAKLERVGVMTGNFEPQIASVRDWSQPVRPGQLDIMDLPDMLADRFGIHNVEVQQQNLLSMEPSYCRRFLERVRKAHSRVCDLSVELDPKGYSGALSVCSSDPQVRAQAVDLTKKWIDRAALLECPSIMPNQGTFPQNPAASIAGLKAIRDYGESKGVAIILEPRGRSTVDTLVEVIRAAGIYANPDIGNFRDEASAERGLRMLYPLARTVGHVKISRRGLDFGKAIQISKEMNFQGVYSIETETSDPYNEMQKVLDLLMENL